MATTSNEKQKKSRFFSFYKPSTGKHKESNKAANLVVDKKNISQSLVLKKEPKALIEEAGGRSSFEGREIEDTRKSVSHLETNLASVTSFLQVKILVSDMPTFMQVNAFRCARTTYDSLEKYSPKHIAFNIKKEFDKVYGPAWHCIVGSNFGSFVTHSKGCFLYFSMEKLYILLFRTKVKKVEECYQID